MEKQKIINKSTKIKNKKRTCIITPKKKVGQTRISKGQSKAELEVTIAVVKGEREKKKEKVTVAKKLGHSGNRTRDLFGVNEAS